MKAYETSTTVQDQGCVLVAGVPFAPGTEVDVTISPKRLPAEDFAGSWQRLCGEFRQRNNRKDITKEDLRAEIHGYRAGQ